jgi:hypothetical protein
MEEVVPGRRLMNAAHVLTQLKRLAAHSQHCTCGDFQLVGEHRDGLKSTLEFECTSCSKLQTVTTDKAPGKEINDAMVWGATCVGIGHYQAQELFGVLECPIMAKRKWNKHALNVEDVRIRLYYGVGLYIIGQYGVDIRLP